MMNTPAPLLRPAIGGGRSSGPRTPRLGLAIPPSPNVKPVGAAPGGISQPTKPSRPALPTLNINTPKGSIRPPQEQPAGHAGAQPVSSGSEVSGVHSRTDSFGGRGSNPASSTSQFSNLSFASQYGLGGKPHGTPDPQSAADSFISNASGSGLDMSRQDSMHGLEKAMDEVTLERVRKLDAEDLDDDGWRVASMENRIVELGGLGEGAGGAVTRCQLKGGKTVFALKVAQPSSQPLGDKSADICSLGDNIESGPGCQETDSSRDQFQQGLRLGPHMQVLRRFPRPFHGNHLHRHGVL